MRTEEIVKEFSFDLEQFKKKCNQFESLVDEYLSESEIELEPYFDSYGGVSWNKKNTYQTSIGFKNRYTKIRKMMRRELMEKTFPIENNQSLEIDFTYGCGDGSVDVIHISWDDKGE